MLPWLTQRHANPHSSHLAGRHAAAAIEQATEHVSKLIGCGSGEVIYTSGATESNNLALRGLIEDKGSAAKLLYSAIEHKAVLEVAAHVRTLGVTTHAVPVDERGQLQLDEVERILAEGPHHLIVTSVMHANNEIGVIQPIDKLSALVTSRGGYLHVDAAQSVGKIEIDIGDLGIDLMSMSAHKLYGPAGIGALYVSPRARKAIRPIFFGGGQQSGLRPGTMPVFLIVGFGAACAIALRRQRQDALHVEAIADFFCRELRRQGAEHDVFDCGPDRLPGLRSIRFKNVEGEDLVACVANEVSISTGSACSGRHIRASHVLRAIGMSEWEAREVVRVGFGRCSTTADATTAATVMSAAVKRLRENP